MKSILPLFIFILSFASCNQGSEETYDPYLANMEESIPITKSSPAPPPPPPVSSSEVDQAEQQNEIEKKIIKDGRVGLQVQDLNKTKLRVDSLVKKYDGYYANESFNNTDWESAYTLKIRIPAVSFETLITSIESGDGEVEYKEIDARDVTDQFIDLETRLENKKSYLKRYKDLLNQAKSVKEILEIEEKIRGLEEEIESTTGRLKYLSDQVDYSTLDLRISKRKEFKYKPDKQDSFFERLKQSLSKGWYVFVDFILFAIRLWPFWIIVPFLVYLWRKFRKKRKCNK